MASFVICWLLSSEFSVSFLEHGIANGVYALQVLEQLMNWKGPLIGVSTGNTEKPAA